MKEKFVEGNIFGKERQDEENERKGDAVLEPHHEMDVFFERLAQSKFRSSFHLSNADKEYIKNKGIATIRKHAKDFVKTRLAPAEIKNDGKQTPWHGHPIFKAQHATGCCCRNCFMKWHNIEKGTTLTPEQQDYAVNILMEWIRRQLDLIQ